MVTVYVWDFRGSKDAWGHASMLVDRFYISYWPSLNRTRQFESELLDLIYCAPAIENRTFDDDVRGEENKQPDHIILINGLDEKSIIKWWKSFASWVGPSTNSTSSEPWCTFDWNCSKVVATALRSGGGDNYSNAFTSSNYVWKPDDVLSYAKSIKQGIKQKRALVNSYRRYSVPVIGLGSSYSKYKAHGSIR